MSTNLKARNKQYSHSIFISKQEPSKTGNSFVDTIQELSKAQLLEKTHSRLKWELWYQKAWDQEFQASLALLWHTIIMLITIKIQEMNRLNISAYISIRERKVWQDHLTLLRHSWWASARCIGRPARSSCSYYWTYWHT